MLSTKKIALTITLFTFFINTTFAGEEIGLEDQNEKFLNDNGAPYDNIKDLPYHKNDHGDILPMDYIKPQPRASMPQKDIQMSPPPPLGNNMPNSDIRVSPPPQSSSEPGASMPDKDIQMSPPPQSSPEPGANMLNNDIEMSPFPPPGASSPEPQQEGVIQNKEEVIESLKYCIRSQFQENIQLREYHDQSIVYIELLKKHKSRSKEENSFLTKENEDMRKEIQLLQMDLQKKDNIIADKDQKIEKFKKDLQNKDEEIAALKKQIDEKKEEEDEESPIDKLAKGVAFTLVDIATLKEPRWIPKLAKMIVGN